MTFLPVPNAFAQSADDEDEEEESDLVVTIDDEELNTAGVPIANGGADNVDRRFAPSKRVGPAGALQEGTGVIEEDPFAALGLRLGTFIVTPSAELGLGFERSSSSTEDPSLPGNFVDQTGSVLGADLTLRLEGASDWSRHVASFELEAVRPSLFSGTASNDEKYSATSSLRLDLGRDSTLTGTVDYLFEREDPLSQAVTDAITALADPDAGAINTPGKHTLGGSLTYARLFGPLLTQVEGSISRTVYSDATITGGAAISQADLNSTQYGLRLRGGYDSGAAITPFAEIELGSRVMDQRPDAAGSDRNSQSQTLRLGTIIDLGPKLNGEVSVGYLREDIVDPTIDDLSAFVFAAELNWSPNRLTNVSLVAGTSTEQGDATSTGSTITYEGDLSVTRRARVNLDLSAGVGLSLEVPGGGDATVTTASAQIGSTYWFNRFLGLTSRLSYEQSFSSDEGSRANTTNAFVGLRLQR